MRLPPRRNPRKGPYDRALDVLHPFLMEWVFRGTGADKRALLVAYETLPGAQREAWDANARRTFAAVHGTGTVRLYRRLKSEAPEQTAGLSVTDIDVTEKAQYVAVYDATADDVLASYLQIDTPLASRTFGHEHEIILKPTNDARLLKVWKAW